MTTDGRYEEALCPRDLVSRLRGQRGQGDGWAWRAGAAGGAGSERDLIKCHPNLYPPFPDDQLDQQTNTPRWMVCCSLPT